MSAVMDDIWLTSYAKINFTLEVSTRRPDGYHDIDSVTQVIDISDELILSRAEKGVLEVVTDSKYIPSGKENLVYRACEAFFKSTGIHAGVRCKLNKNIPAQAGLGGGSGNVAAAVAGLNRLFDCNLPIEKIAEITSSVSSDTALFVYGGTARMRGRGELVEKLPDAPTLHLVIIKPSTGVSTPWAYTELDKRNERYSAGMSNKAEQAIRQENRSLLISALSNDFDPVISTAFAQIREAKEALSRAGAEAAMLCGSGSAVFGVFPSRERAELAAESLRDKFPYIIPTRTLTRKESIMA